MTNSFSIMYDGGEELIISDGKLVRSELGTLLISFLSMDFSAEKWDSLTDVNTHPLVALALRLAREGGAEIRGVCRAMDQFRQLLSQTAEAVLQDTPGDTSAAMKLSRICRENRTVEHFFQALSGKIRSELCGISGLTLIEWGQEETPERFAMVYSADGLQPLLLFELEQMAVQNCYLKKCANCGCYFRPFSYRTLYCDRIFEDTGKTCKEYAARERYEQKIASDEALTLYQRRNKTYAMRVSRSQEPIVAEQYRTWRAEADNAMNRYREGAISFEELSARLELPSLTQRPHR